MTFRRLPFFLVTALAVSPLFAATRYVREGGPPNGDGSEARPFATLAEAESGSLPGDTIMLARGKVYSGGITLQNGQSLLAAPAPEAEAAPRIRVMDGAAIRVPAAATVTLEGVALELSSSARGFAIEGSVVVRGGALTGRTSASAIELSGNAARGQFEGFVIDLVTGTAVDVHGGTDVALSFDGNSSIGVSAAERPAVRIAETNGRVMFDGPVRITAAAAVEALVDVKTVRGSLTFESILLDGASVAVGGLSVDGFEGALSVAHGRIDRVRRHGISVTRSQGVTIASVTLAGTPSENGADAAVCGTPSAAGSHLSCAAAILLQDSGSISFDGVTIEDGAQVAIAGDGVRDLTLSRTVVRGAGDENQEHGIQLRNVAGTFRVAHSTFEKNESRQLYVVQDQGEVRIEVDDVSFIGGKPPHGGQALLLAAQGEALVRLRLKSSRFERNFGNAVQLLAEGSSTVTASIEENEFSNGAAGFVATGSDAATLQYRVSRNSFLASSATPVVAHAAGGAKLIGEIVENRIARAACGGGCSGITVTAIGKAESSARVERNEIGGTDAHAILARATGDADLRVRVQGNALRAPAGGDSLGAIQVAAGSRAGDRARVCADLGGSGEAVNTVAGAWNASGGGAGIVLQRRGEYASLAVARYAGDAANSETLSKFVAGNNRGTAVEAIVGGGVVLSDGCDVAAPAMVEE